MKPKTYRTRAIIDIIWPDKAGLDRIFRSHLDRTPLEFHERPDFVHLCCPPAFSRDDGCFQYFFSILSHNANVERVFSLTTYLIGPKKEMDFQWSQ